jgi:hypothetical protein
MRPRQPLQQKAKAIDQEADDCTALSQLLFRVRAKHTVIQRSPSLTAAESFDAAVLVLGARLKTAEAKWHSFQVCRPPAPLSTVLVAEEQLGLHPCRLYQTLVKALHTSCYKTWRGS